MQVQLKLPFPLKKKKPQVAVEFFTSMPVDPTGEANLAFPRMYISKNYPDDFSAETIKRVDNYLNDAIEPASKEQLVEWVATTQKKMAAMAGGDPKDEL
eukprot:m.187782 g.187782  ORF g.187782 m.187782 type:complete len:99 (+) comp25627_c1_seq14:778-1074(+)